MITNLTRAKECFQGIWVNALLFITLSFLAIFYKPYNGLTIFFVASAFVNLGNLLRFIDLEKYFSNKPPNEF